MKSKTNVWDLPKKIKMGRRSMKVVIEPEVLIDGTKNWGAAGYAQRQIRMSKEQPDSEVMDTFIHELVHLIFADKGVNHRVGSDEEYLVATISAGLTDMFYENPQLVHYIQERVNE